MEVTSYSDAEVDEKYSNFVIIHYKIRKEVKDISQRFLKKVRKKCLYGSAYSLTVTKYKIETIKYLIGVKNLHAAI